MNLNLTGFKNLLGLKTKFKIQNSKFKIQNYLICS